MSFLKSNCYIEKIKNASDMEAERLGILEADWMFIFL